MLSKDEQRLIKNLNSRGLTTLSNKIIIDLKYNHVGATDFYPFSMTS